MTCSRKADFCKIPVNDSFKLLSLLTSGVFTALWITDMAALGIVVPSCFLQPCSAPITSSLLQDSYRPGFSTELPITSQEVMHSHRKCRLMESSIRISPVGFLDSWVSGKLQKELDSEIQRGSIDVFHLLFRDLSCSSTIMTDWSYSINFEYFNHFVVCVSAWLRDRWT